MPRVRSVVSPLLPLALLVALLGLCLPALADGPRVAVLDIDLLKPDYFPAPDTVTADEQQRLDAVAGLLRERLAADGYAVVPAAQVSAAIARADTNQYLYECNGCERDIARDLDADWVMVGWVQIVSNLIINLNVRVLDVASGASMGQAFVDLRGNNERSWRRATTYLLDNVLMERLDAARAARNPARP